MRKRKTGIIALALGAIVISSGAMSMKETASAEEAQDTQNTSYKNIVTNTYADGGGDYTLRGLLNSFNIVSARDIESKHVVGAVAAGFTAYHTRPNPRYEPINGYGTQTMYLADLSRGQCSFVRNLVTTETGAPAFMTNMGMDTADSKAPYLYVGENVELIDLGTENDPVQYIVNGDKDPFISPFNGGRPIIAGTSGIRQNNNYFDFEKALAYANQDGQSLITNGTLSDGRKEVIVVENAGTKLNIEVGKSYLIKDASKLQDIDFDFGDHDYFNKPYPGETIISFECSTINPGIVNGLSATRFPRTLINGSEISFADLGKYNEWTEYGNKIIFNMPNIYTSEDGANRVTEFGWGQNLIGHMNMPNAEFWNYQGQSNAMWAGGNINGTIICKSFHGGEAEIHMWPYDGKEEQSAKIELELDKRLDGEVAVQEFDFKLTPYKGDVLDPSGAMYGKSNSEGKIVFPELSFSLESTYKFLLEEVVDESNEEIIYDRSQYHIYIEVQMIDGKLIPTITYERIKNNLGEDIAPEDVENVVYQNETVETGDFVLPETGGVGTSLYTISGLSLMSYAIFKNTTQRGKRDEEIK